MTGTRSTGCGTCRKRKVKCDEAKPICRRCVKAKLDCTGYNKAAVFFEDWKKREQAPVIMVKPRKPVLEWKIGPQMTTKGLQKDYFISFLTSQLFSRRKADGIQEWYSVRVRDLPTPGLALEALVTYFYGRYNRIQDITRQGVAYYSQALIKLRDDLQGPEAYSVSTLMTTVLLSMYELIGYSSSGGWIAHAGGLARLIEARGPGAHSSGTGRAIFLDQRTLIVSEAVLNQKRTFVSKPEWKTLPWLEDPASKTPWDYLVDITADAAGYSEDVGYITLYNEDQLLELSSEVHRSLDELDAWWRGWATKLVDQVTERPPNPALNISFDDDGPVFDTIIKYADFWACYVTICHNSTRILLLQILDQVIRAGQAFDLEIEHRVTEESSLLLSGITTNTDDLAMEILRAVEFFETQSKLFLGAFCILSPFVMAQRCLDPESRAAKWLYNLPGRNLASYRRAAGEQDHGSALPTCGCMMIDSIVANSEDRELTGQMFI